MMGAAAGACGKKGNPLPPLRPVPARVSEFSAARTEGRVTLRMVVPSANTDNSTPAAIDRIDVFRVGTVTGAPVPPASVIAGNPKNLRTHINVRRPVESSEKTTADDGDKAAAGNTTTKPADTRPTAGDTTTFVDTLEAGGTPPVAAWHYVVVPIAGTGRGRPGPASSVLSLTLGDLPISPDRVTIAFDDTKLTATWQPAATGQSFIVWRTPGRVFDAATAKTLNDTPQTSTELSMPVHFDQEVCLAVSAVRATGGVRAEGHPSAVSCLTPVDRFPPAPPTGLQAVQEGDVVTLIWTPVDATDVAGYVILRGEGSAESLQPLMRNPVDATTFRDTAVQPGVTYTYAVYAVDTARVPNVSQLSARQTVTVR